MERIHKSNLNVNIVVDMASLSFPVNSSVIIIVNALEQDVQLLKSLNVIHVMVLAFRIDKSKLILWLDDEVFLTLNMIPEIL